MAENLVINEVTYPEVKAITVENEEGNPVAFYPDAVRYNEQALTEEQQAQARENIGAASSKEVSSLSEEKVDKTGVSLGIASDGLIYLFLNGTPTGTGIPQGQSGDVFGYVDENNTVVLTGNLAEGTYTIKYEMEDGSTVDIGELELDNNVYYSVSNSLTNCTNSNSDTQAVGGESYSATISANSGYELSSVLVTMGGTDISASAVSGGTISIASVTGNIVITAVATETTSEPENVLETVGYIADTRIRSSNGETQTLAGVEATGFIPIAYGQRITIENITLVDSGNNSVAVYDANKNFIAGNYMAAFLDGVVAGSATAVNGERKSQTLTVDKWTNATLTESSPVAFIRFSANEITDNSIVYITD